MLQEGNDLAKGEYTMVFDITMVPAGKYICHRGHWIPKLLPIE